MSYGHPWRSMTAGPSGGPASAYPTLSTPASICFSAPNGLCVPAVIVVPFAVFIVVAEPIVVCRLGRRRPGRGRDEVGHRLHRRWDWAYALPHPCLLASGQRFYGGRFPARRGRREAPPARRTPRRCADAARAAPATDDFCPLWRLRL